MRFCRTNLNAGENLKWPEVPPSVLEAGKKGGVDAEIAEMREYFRAFVEQDEEIRDYKKYFPSQLCYMEGWLEYDRPGGKLDDPFLSERHELEVNTWHDLMDNVRARMMAGEKSELENGAYLPQIVVDVTESGNPVRANFAYAIKCHQLEDDKGKTLSVPFDRMRKTRDLHTEDSGWSFDYHSDRRALFEVDPTCEAAFKADGNPPFTRTGKQVKICKGNTKTSEIQQSYIDSLMSQIPGKDMYGAEIWDDRKANPLNASQPLNAAYYNRVFRSLSKDANNEVIHMRGFHDGSLWVAETTHPRVVGFHEKGRSAGKQKKGKGTAGSLRGGRAFSWAIPFELVYLSPLKEWNPYKLKHFGEDEAKKEQKGNGCRGKTGLSKAAQKKCAFNGISKNKYWATPKALWTKDLDPAAVDSADTSGSAMLVLDPDGEPRATVASGVSVFTGPVGESVGRMRWPIFPLHEEGSTTWKELKVMQEMLASRGNKGFQDIARANFPVLSLVTEKHIQDQKDREQAEIDKWVLYKEKWHCGNKERTKKSEVKSASSQGHCANKCSDQKLYYYEEEGGYCACFRQCPTKTSTPPDDRWAYAAGGNVYKKKDLVLVQRRLVGGDHAHTVSLTPRQRTMVSNGHPVVAHSSVAAGHAHLVEIGPRADDDDAADHLQALSLEEPPLAEDIHVTYCDGAPGACGHSFSEEDEIVRVEEPPARAPSGQSLADLVRAQQEQIQALRAEMEELKGLRR